MRAKFRRGCGVVSVVAVVLGCLWLGGCFGARLSVSLFYPYGPEGTKAFDQISLMGIRVRGQAVTGEDGKSGVSETQFTVDSESPRLPNVPCTTDSGEKRPELELEVIGYDDNDKVVASGRRVLYHPCGEARNISLFVSPVNAFSTLTQISDKGNDRGKMDETRVGHRVTYLSDGRLFVTGGGRMFRPGQFSEMFKSTELFEPETGQFKPGPNMSEARSFHTVSKVGDRLLLAGGVKAPATPQAKNPLSSDAIDVFERDSEGRLTRIKEGRLAEARSFHSAVTTPNSNYILIFGGVQWNDSGVKMATKWEVFDPEKGRSVQSGEIPAQYQRAWHSATLIEGRTRVLIAGGAVWDAQKGSFTISKNMFVISFDSSDDTKLTFASVGDMKEARAAHTATRLKNGNVLLVGGMTGETTNLFFNTSISNSMEVLGPNGASRSSAQLPALKHARVFHDTIEMEDGRIVIYGGVSKTEKLTRGGKTEDVPIPAPSAEMYRFNENFQNTPPASVLVVRKPRFHQSATLMLNGSLLILGGATVEIDVLKSAGNSPDLYNALFRGELFNPGPRPEKDSSNSN